MAFITADFVKESSTVTGTGAITLAGVRSPGQTFAAVCANGDTFHYAISHETLNEWEEGVGTYNSGPNTISRSPTRSSNSNNLVNFSAGTKRVDLVVPAERIVLYPGPVSAGTQTLGSGALAFANSNGVTWGMNAGTVTASVAAVGANIPLVSHSGGVSMTNVTQLVFSNASNVTWGPATGANNFVVIASAGDRSVAEVRVQGTTVNSVTRIEFSNANGVSFNAGSVVGGISVAASVEPRVGIVSHVGGNSVASATRIAFSNANGVSFSLSTAAGGATLQGSVANATREIHIVSHVGGNVVSSVSQLAFSNASNVTFSLSTAGNAATLLASVAAAGAASLTVSGSNGSFSATALSFATHGSAGRVNFFSTTGTQVAAIANIAFSAGTVFQNAAAIGLADGSGVSWSYAGSQITASVGRELALVSHVGGNSVGTVRSLVFEDASNVTWSLSTAASAATVRASVAAGGGGADGGVGVSAAGQSASAGTVTFSNSNNVSFGMAGSVITATATVALPAALAVSAAGASASAGTVVWSNSNNVSFGQNGSTITASASFAAPAATREIGIVSHVGGNVVSSVSQLAFSNASNVTFSLSTAANAATLIASVAAGGGGGGITYSGYAPAWGNAVIVTQSLTNNSFWVQPMNSVPSFQFDRVIQLFGLSNATNASNTNTLRMIVGLYTQNASTLSLLSSTSFSSAFTGSGTAGSYSLFSGPRHVTIGWTGTLGASNYWLGVAASLSTAGNSSYSVSFGMLSQSLGVPVYGFGLASNATYQSALGKGFYTATTTAAPGSIAFSQINGSSSAAYRFPAFLFQSGTA
jgi:hypothetical protein